VALNGEVGSGVGEWGRQIGVCWFVWSLCVFRYISVFVVEGACVRDCTGLRLCKVAIVGWSVVDESVGGRGSLVTGSGRMGGEGEG
jgi:hypothetical protein